MTECVQCRMITLTSWTLITIIAAITLFVTRNTKESLNCRKETLSTIIVIIIQLVTTFVGKPIGVPYEWRLFIGNTIAWANFCTLLVVPLYMIYKIEGTINHKKITMRQSSENPSNQDLMDHLKSEKCFHSLADFLV